MKTGVLLILLAIVVAAGSKYISIRNGLVRERETIDAAWAQVEAALGHRASLVPELVEALGSGAPNPAGAIDGLARVRRQQHGAAVVRVGDFADGFQSEVVTVDVECVQEFPVASC